MQQQSLELHWVDPRDLDENPLNWRIHPPSQRDAVDSLLTSVGWAGALLYNRRTGRLIDGHLRRELAIERGDEAVPVLVGDWSEEQERILLALYDHTTSMAVPDVAALDALLERVAAEADSGALRETVDLVALGHAATPAYPDVEAFSGDQPDAIGGPRLIFSFADEEERRRFFAHFGHPPSTVVTVTAAELLSAMGDK